MGRGRGPAGSDALQGRGARSSPVTPGLRSPAASRGRSPSARPGTLPLPKCRLQGCAVRSDWWSRQHLLKSRRERNEPAMNDALHRPGHRGRHRVSAASAAISQPTVRTPTLGSSSVPPAGRELFLLGASLLPRQTPGFLLSTNANFPSSSCVPKRLKGSDSFRPFSPQCDISDFSLLSVPGKRGLPYPQSPGAGVVFTQLNSSLHRFRGLE